MNTLPSPNAAKLNFKFFLKFLAIAGFILAPQFIFMALHQYDPIVEKLFGYSAVFHDVPIDTQCRWGKGTEVSELADFGYDTARDFVRLLTVVSSYLSTFFAIKIAFRNGFGKFSRPLVLLGLSVQYVIPVLVHLIGIFTINNSSGPCGGL